MKKRTRAAGDVVSYDDFRTGLTFREVRQMLWVNNDDPETWRYKRRRTVLGFWHQLKLQLWAQYLDAVDGDRRRATGGG
jgi:hypothetical protein